MFGFVRDIGSGVGLGGGAEDLGAGGAAHASGSAKATARQNRMSFTETPPSSVEVRNALLLTRPREGFFLFSIQIRSAK
jgi:hypothetical protein